MQKLYSLVLSLGLMAVAGCSTISAPRGYTDPITKSKIRSNQTIDDIITSAENNGYVLYRQNLDRSGSVSAVFLGETHSDYFDKARTNVLNEPFAKGAQLLVEGAQDHPLIVDELHKECLAKEWGTLKNNNPISGWDVRKDVKDDVTVATVRLIKFYDMECKLLDGIPFSSFDFFILYQESKIIGEGLPTNEMLEKEIKHQGLIRRNLLRLRNQSMYYQVIKSIGKNDLSFVTCGALHVDIGGDLLHSNDLVLNRLESHGMSYLAFKPAYAQKGELNATGYVHTHADHKDHWFKILNKYLKIAEDRGAKFEGEIDIYWLRDR